MRIALHAGPSHAAWTWANEIVAQAVTVEDEVITARCDLDMGKRYRETIFNFAKHREPEAYRLIVERKGAIPPPED